MAPTGTGEEEHELQKDRVLTLTPTRYLTTAPILVLSPVVLPSQACHAHLTEPQLSLRN